MNWTSWKNRSWTVLRFTPRGGIAGKAENCVFFVVCVFSSVPCVGALFEPYSKIRRFRCGGPGRSETRSLGLTCRICVSEEHMWERVCVCVCVSTRNRQRTVQGCARGGSPVMCGCVCVHDEGVVAARGRRRVVPKDTLRQRTLSCWGAVVRVCAVNYVVSAGQEVGRV